jgi:hypothetical protein
VSHLLASLSVATHTTPAQWVDELDRDPRMVATVLEVLRKHHGR